MLRTYGAPGCRVVSLPRAAPSACTGLFMFVCYADSAKPITLAGSNVGRRCGRACAVGFLPT
jgi:hypothetical protein